VGRFDAAVTVVSPCPKPITAVQSCCVRGGGPMRKARVVFGGNPMLTWLAIVGAILVALWGLMTWVLRRYTRLPD
jgi:hypothetical protein